MVVPIGLYVKETHYTYDLGVNFRMRVIFLITSSLCIPIISSPVIGFFCLMPKYNTRMYNFHGN